MFLTRKRLTGFLLCALWLIICLTPLSGGAVEADAETKIVRVGWYESAFHRTDQFGRRSGYGYEYQQRIATYTGWTYEYIEGSWSELLEKLIAGEIDLLSDVSYTPERAEKILYSAEPMGSEGYHVFIAPENTEIRPDDFSSLNGKKVAVNKNSIQERLFVEWTEAHGVTPEILEVSEKTPVLLEMLANGEFDALVTLDTYGNTADIVPVWKVGFADSYFGISRSRPDVKRELDLAMSRLFEDNRDFNQTLTEKFNRSGSVSSFLSPEEKSWLADHPVIRIGYRYDFLPYSDYDEESGLLTGALSDFIAFAATCQKNATLTFETEPYQSTAAAFEALKAGTVDCIFPLYLSAYDGEQIGVIVTDPFVTTAMFVLVRSGDVEGISPEREMTVSVLKGHLSHETFLKDHFPNWQIKYYDSNEESFRAVASGETNCTLVSNYRVRSITDLAKKYNLVPLSTGEELGLSFAVNRQDDCLYSILNKAIRIMPATTINTALTRYGSRELQVTFRDFLRENWPYFVAGIACVVVIILLLIIRNIRSEAKLEEGQQIISQAERDQLTGLYNRSFFYIYAGRMAREHPEKPMDGVAMNIDRFHSVNALHGREFGDRILREVGAELQQFISETEGFAARSEADRFYMYCLHREDWQAQLDRFQARLDNLSGNTKVHLRMGIAPWKEGMDPILQMDRARTACNRVRGDFTAQVVIYDTAMEQKEERDQRMLSDLDRALANREFEVYYQPKFLIQGEKPVLSSAEALVRWQHPDLGLQHPDMFVPLFESTGRITALDTYVWEEAARQIAAWRSCFGKTIPVSVNLSRVDVFDPALCATLDGIIARYGLSTTDLMLEVTESAYTENADQLILVIEQLRGKGYRIEMDDFGSGYSSLNMLSSMPIDVLKMDIAFIRRIERNEKDFHLVELIVDIARYLKVPVVAEGVETKNQLKLLKNAGCDLVQGYYFSQPLPPEEFEKKILKKAL